MMGPADRIARRPVHQGRDRHPGAHQRAKSNGDSKIYPCIKCAACVDACPMHLNPSRLGMLARKERYEEMEAEFHLNDCFECGCCSYVCPAQHSAGAIFPRRQADEPESEGARMKPVHHRHRSPDLAAPALRAVRSISIMRNVVYALLPALRLFGLAVRHQRAGLLIATTTAACVLTEHILCRVSGKTSSVGDFSVVITGVLLGLILPPGFAVVDGCGGRVHRRGSRKNAIRRTRIQRLQSGAGGPRVSPGGFPGGDHVLHARACAAPLYGTHPVDPGVPLMKAAPLGGWIAKVARGRVLRRHAADACKNSSTSRPICGRCSWASAPARPAKRPRC